eukprot:NODE_222_length_1165_cov_741.088710_g179_i0.p1 GENE.NODE_222_length_1165_cov_741.088710_g179_i0~~NODE_222_length_1165_cov_741.088710_g179_i0.p1  ORF type:complete len:375 (+),score=65.39 NODE_222_length_1165_cov_741.088710_g179_i0:30-1127(+)
MGGDHRKLCNILELCLLLQRRHEEALMAADRANAVTLLHLLSLRVGVHAPIPNESPCRLAAELGVSILFFSLHAESQICTLNIWVISADVLRYTVTEFPSEALQMLSLMPTANPRRDLRHLYDVLLRPVAHWLGGSECLSIVANGKLLAVPWSLLVFDGPDGADMYLLERYAISTVPSLRVLLMLQRHVRPPAERREISLLALEHDVPGGYAELRKVVDVFNFDAETTKTVAHIQRRLPEVRYAHFACHGVAGNLKSEDIQKLELSGSLAFLSACDTGRGTVTADGVISLHRAFLSAGFCSVVGTHWPLSGSWRLVDTVDEFYHQVLDGVPPSVALQRAALRVRQGSPGDDGILSWGVLYVEGLP